MTVAPCPFCGADEPGHVVERLVSPRNEIRVATACGKCGARGPFVDADHEHADATRLTAFAGRADAAWDRRHTVHCGCEEPG